MQIGDYLEQHQSIVYKTFSNALKNNKLSHAYLLSGTPGMPLKDVAMFLGKSILCDNPNPLACNECITCTRIDEGMYADFMVFDGSTNRIKKGDVEKIINNFDKSALESKGIMIYVLHLVETMTPIAVNSLLKFLEEPGRNIYAFLTTENEAKILPTIISRTQVLRLREIDREQVINTAVLNGIYEEDAEFLSIFYNDYETIKLHVEDENYQIAKQAINDQINALLMSADDAIFTCQKLITPKLKSVEVTKMYLLMLGNIFQDLINLKIGEKIFLNSMNSVLSELANNLNHLDKSLLTIMSSINKLEMNVNIPLLLDHVIFEITKGEK